MQSLLRLAVPWVFTDIVDQAKFEFILSRGLFEGRSMANIIGIIALAFQYGIIVLVVELFSGKLHSLWIILAVFLALVGVGLVVWDNENFSDTWIKHARSSVILGIAFLGCDALLGYFFYGHVNPFSFRGGLLSIPLTLAVCPGFTMICMAGLLRDRYVSKMSGPH